MLFDALINLFKTICIGVIAFSPLIVYKFLDESSSVSAGSNVNVSASIDYNEPEIKKTSEETNSSKPSVFQNQNFFSNTGAPPPPPVQGEDVPIDTNIGILLFAGLLYGIYKYSKISLRKHFTSTIC